MIHLEGKYNYALIMTDYPGEEALSQVKSLLDSPQSANCKIRYMADMHRGKGCTVGYTQTLTNFVVPNFIGVDIGCGIYSYNLGIKKSDIDFDALDIFIKQNIPSGFAIRSKPIDISQYLEGDYYQQFTDIIEKLKLDKDKVLKSLGTLGGGNHFIELDEDPNGDVYLTLHTGSRNFGLQVCNYYQKLAKEFTDSCSPIPIISGMEYLPVKYGGLEYLSALNIAQKFAHINRTIIAEKICNLFFGIDVPQNNIQSVHNYIDFTDNIIRKGAIRAHKDEIVVIPFNMRDGVAVCIGKGSEKWNYSAPHGAGRKMSRKKARESINIDEYKESMKGIYTSCINESTLDESPFAYKNYETVIEEMKETVDVLFVMKPIYNFKAS